MAFAAVSHLIGLMYFKNRGQFQGAGRAAKLPPAADFAGAFTSP
jgi:hypothetical protein